MAATGIRVEGAKEFRSALRSIAPELRAEMRTVNLEAARVVLPVALARVPVRSGRLRSTIRVLASQRAGRVAAGKKLVPYAGPIHFGWPARHIRPQPFLWNAIDSRRSQVIAVYERRVSQVVDNAMRRTR